MEKLEEFYALVVSIWDDGIYGIDVSRIVTAIGIFLLFVIIRHLFARLILVRLEKLAEKTSTDFDDKLIAGLKKPLHFIPIVIGLFFAIDHLDLHDAPQEVADGLLRSLIAFTFFWAIFNAVDPLSIFLRRLRRILTPSMIEWLIKAIKAAVVLVGVATILETWGVEIAPVLASLGLLGVAVALGAQDMFRNLIAGLLILSERRFHQGDWIKVDGIVEGTVAVIGFRSTRIIRFDKAPVYVPNSKLADNAVTNFSAMSHRRISWVIGLEYRTTIEQLRKVRDEIETYLISSGEFASPPDAVRFVRIDRFNDSSIDIMIYCFTNTTNWGEWLEIKENLACRIKEIVEEAGTGFAFPSQSVYLESVPGDGPTIFDPARKTGDAEDALAGAGPARLPSGQAGGAGMASGSGQASVPGQAE